MTLYPKLAHYPWHDPANPWVVPPDTGNPVIIDVEQNIIMMYRKT